MASQYFSQLLEIGINIKCTYKCTHNIHTDSNHLNGILLQKYFLFIKKYWTVLNIDENDKCFLNRKSASCNSDAEHVALITGIYYSLKYIQIDSSYFK